MGRWPWKMEVKALLFYVVTRPPGATRDLIRAFWMLIRELRRFGTLAWVFVPPVLVLVFVGRGWAALLAAVAAIGFGLAAVIESGAHRDTWRRRVRRKLYADAAKMPEERRRMEAKP